MIRKTEFMKLSLLQLLIVIIAATTPAVGYYNSSDYYAVNESYFKELILNIYIDEAGRAVVTGYVEYEDIDSLTFLKMSEYLYENDTKQLYALTNALTWKYGENWEINFTTCGYYRKYHTIFYLPDSVRLRSVKCSEGLEYFVTVSNESLVIDVHGYEVNNPIITIEYQQPFKETGGEGPSFNFGYLYLPIIITLSALTLVLGISLAKMKVREDARGMEAATVKRAEIELTPEMGRVMETLTDREQAIVKALIKHSGEMTQADLRYETGIPKSSLTGILRTLERRKIINKKEWGRTNVIELSEWFLTKKERK